VDGENGHNVVEYTATLIGSGDPDGSTAKLLNNMIAGVKMEFPMHRPSIVLDAPLPALEYPIVGDESGERTPLQPRGMGWDWSGMQWGSRGWRRATA
jgi:hypothetical protein